MASCRGEPGKAVLHNTTKGTFIVPPTNSDHLCILELAALNAKMRYTLFKLLGNAAHCRWLKQTLRIKM